MRLLQNLRDHMLAQDLGITAKQLLTYADKGGFYAPQGLDQRGGSFQVKYTATMVVTDFAQAAEPVYFAALQWFNQHCPDCDPSTITFEVDIHNHKTCDLMLSLPVQEIVRVRFDDDGKPMFATPATADWRDQGLASLGLAHADP